MTDGGGDRPVGPGTIAVAALASGLVAAAVPYFLGLAEALAALLGATIVLRLARDRGALPRDPRWTAVGVAAYGLGWVALAVPAVGALHLGGPILGLGGLPIAGWVRGRTAV
ncbi:MAG TPA: hypothetical protein VMH78_02815 [Thermoplasmata archaeon]|nr:hypothetical protein [Thermoplasmata archaeon]